MNKKFACNHNGKCVAVPTAPGCYVWVGERRCLGERSSVVKHAYCSARGRGFLRDPTAPDWPRQLLKWGVNEETSNSFVVENFMKLY